MQSEVERSAHSCNKSWREEKSQDSHEAFEDYFFVVFFQVGAKAELHNNQIPLTLLLLLLFQTAHRLVKKHE